MLVHSSHSEERLGRLRMGDCECSFQLCQPKYKRRRVIPTVRDFPPGCGHFAQKINSQPTKDLSCTDNLENSLGGHLGPQSSGMLTAVEDAELRAESPLLSYAELKDECGLVNAESERKKLPQALVASKVVGLTNDVKNEHETNSSSKDLRLVEVIEQSSSKFLSAPDGHVLDLTKKFHPQIRVPLSETSLLFSAPLLCKDENQQIVILNYKSSDLEFAEIDDKLKMNVKANVTQVIEDVDVHHRNACKTELGMSIYKLTVDNQIAPQINLRLTEDVECVGNEQNSLHGHRNVMEPAELFNRISVIKPKAKMSTASFDKLEGRGSMSVESVGTQFPNVARASEHLKDKSETSSSKNVQVVEEMVQSTSLNSFSAPDSHMTVPNTSGVVGAMIKNIPARRRVSAIRDFPTCERKSRE